MDGAARRDEREDIEAGDAVPVTHRFSTAVHARAVRDLDRAVAAARRAVGEHGR